MQHEDYMLNSKFGKLTVIKEVESDIKGHRKFLCLCQCGENAVVIANNLKKGNTTQCKSCADKQRKDKNTVVNSNLSKETYVIFSAMKYRCSKEERYISRGITVCERWSDPVDGFRNFLEDMGERPDGYSIDRINNDLGYYKENCRWTTSSVQNHNKSKRKDAKTSEYIGVSFTEKGSKWVVQFQIDGDKSVSRFISEEDAAVHYDNLSEDYYDDRPNGTVRKEVKESERKVGGISFCSKTNKFRVRFTHSGKRINVGFFESFDEAESALELAKQSVNN